MFNVRNTILLIWFIPQIAFVVEKLVKPTARDADTNYKLQYISTPLQETADMNIIEAKKEIEKMAHTVEEMFCHTMEIYKNPNKKLADKVEQIQKTEQLTDQMQEEITKYLQKCASESISEKNYANINVLMRIVHELENIGDSNSNLCLTLQHKYEKKILLHPQAEADILSLSKLIETFIDKLKNNIVNHIGDDILNDAYNLEEIINEMRRSVRKAARVRMQEGSDVRSELLFLDLVKYLEHIGDNSLNIMQALNQMA
jgi:phosphate:Na+ symporter